MTKFFGRNNKIPIIGLSYRPYSQDVRKLKKTYRNIESDLNEMFERIAKDPKRACSAGARSSAAHLEISMPEHRSS